MPYPMIIPQYSMSPVMMAGGGSAATQPPMMPVAKALANQGRMTDSTLVHMNPQEVAGLQSLARQNGTSLTINPQTGLPEAFNLRSILPAVAGAALTPVLGPMAPLVVGGLGALATGSLEQGLMMGLGAYGGANLATSLAGTAANLAAPAAAGASTAGAEVAAAELAAQQAAAQAATTQAAAAANIAPPVDISGNILGIDEMAVAGGQGVSQIAGLPPTGISKLFTPDPNVTYQNIGSGLKNVFSSGENAMNFLGDNKMNLAMSAAPMLITPEQEAAEERNRAMIRPYEYQVDNLSGTDVDPYGTEAERLRGRFVAQNPYYAAKGGLMSLAEGGSTSGSTTTAPATTASTTTAPAAQTPSSLLINLSPAEAEVYRNIFAVQQMAGVPLSMPGSMPTGSAPAGIASLPSMFVMSPPATTAPATPAVPVAYTPSMVGTAPALDTSEKKYDVFDPVAAAAAKETPRTGGGGRLEFNPGEGLIALGGFGETAADRAAFERSAWVNHPAGITASPGYAYMGYYGFAEGGSVPNASSQRYSYDSQTNSYKMMAQGGLTALKAGGRAGRKKISRSDPFYEFGLDLGKVAEEQFAAGGLKEGAFIVPADVISHLGNGSSEAGMKIVQERLKGRPIKGPGDGMSDSIPTTIAGKQPARVANEEAEIPPEVVAALGGGSLEKGAKKLYEMMDKIRKDRTGKKKQAPAVKADKYVPA